MFTRLNPMQILGLIDFVAVIALAAFAYQLIA